MPTIWHAKHYRPIQLIQGWVLFYYLLIKIGLRFEVNSHFLTEYVHWFIVQWVSLVWFWFFVNLVRDRFNHRCWGFSGEQDREGLGSLPVCSSYRISEFIKQVIKKRKHQIKTSTMNEIYRVMQQNTWEWWSIFVEEWEWVTHPRSWRNGFLGRQSCKSKN